MQNFVTQLINSQKKNLKPHKRVKLLKEVKKLCQKTFEQEPPFKAELEILGKERINDVKNAVFDADFSTIGEFNEEFFKVYNVTHKYNDLIRTAIRETLIQLDSGFDEFEKILIKHSTIISSLYDFYYIDWTKAVRTTPAAQKIMNMQKNNPTELEKVIKEKQLDNQYTINSLDAEGNLTTKPYAIYFQKTLTPILLQFDVMLEELEKAATTDEHKKYIKYLQSYKEALACTDIGKLEKKWIQVDIAWLDVKHPIQIVHDIESDYGDPLRVKVIPDFSIRFLDEEYQEENQEIEKIKSTVISLFEKRNTELAKSGIKSVNNCMAGIYYLPFNSAMSLHFKFSGQSIPNRPEIAKKYGVKIYFDPIATAKRAEKVKELSTKVLANKKYLQYINYLDSIIYHTAPHEFGHVIYILKDIDIPSKYQTGLEELRAERIALNTMNKYFQNDRKKLLQLVISFALSDLRRFDDFNSSTLRPYITSAIDTYNIYEKTGFMRVENEKLVINPDKLEAIMKQFEKELEAITNAEDKTDVNFFENLLKQATTEGKLVKWLVNAFK